MYSENWKKTEPDATSQYDRSSIHNVILYSRK
jgi:hypothetical protein